MIPTHVTKFILARRQHTSPVRFCNWQYSILKVSECHHWYDVKYRWWWWDQPITNIVVSTIEKFTNYILYFMVMLFKINFIQLNPLHGPGDIQKSKLPTAKINSRDVLSMCQDIFGHVGRNYL